MNQYIDHTLLKPEATLEQIKALCGEAIKYQFKSVCINPAWISTAKEILNGSNVLICTVVGFPLGATLTSVKAFETTKAIENGADEIDMVLNIGALKSKNFALVQEDIKAVVNASGNKIVKVIFETCLLTDEEIITACELSIKAGADFVKTSTGFSTSGANENVVKIMLEQVKDKAQVKASGGVRSYEDAKKYIDMGVKRLGTSSGIAIMNGEISKSNY